MNQKIIVGIVVAVVVVGGWLLLSKESGAPAPGVNESAERGVDTEHMMENKGETMMGQGRISELLAKGRPISCSFVHNNAEMGTGNGMGYFDGKRMRVDSNLMKDGLAFESHVIHDGMKMYTWTKSDEGNYAFMMDVSDTDTPPQGNDTRPQQQALDEQVEYQCDPWNVEDSKFVPPSDIKFSDMTAMMGGNTNMQGMNHMMDDGTMMQNLPSP